MTAGSAEQYPENATEVGTISHVVGPLGSSSSSAKANFTSITGLSMASMRALVVLMFGMANTQA